MAVSLESVHYLCINKMHKLREQGGEKNLIWPKSKYLLIFSGRYFYSILYSSDRKAGPQTSQVIFCWLSVNSSDLPCDSVSFQPSTLQERAFSLWVGGLADPRENHQVNISHQVCVRVREYIREKESLSDGLSSPHWLFETIGSSCEVVKLSGTSLKRLHGLQMASISLSHANKTS